MLVSFKVRQDSHGIWMREDMSKDMEKSSGECSSIFSGKDGWISLGKKR